MGSILLLLAPVAVIIYCLCTYHFTGRLAGRLEGIAVVLVFSAIGLLIRRATKALWGYGEENYASDDPEQDRLDSAEARLRAEVEMNDRLRKREH